MEGQSLQLGHGTKAFSEIRVAVTDVSDAVAKVAQAQAPKPTKWLQIVGAFSGTLIVLLTAWWGLSTKFSDRPTEAKVDQIMQAHVSSEGHPAMAAEIKAVHEAQVEQGADLRNLTKSVDDMRADIKDLTVAVQKIRSP